MQISPFLTDIAKSYNPKVEYVAFCDLPGRQLGEAGRPRAIEEYKILIDRNKLICPYQVLFILFHEIGHIELYHLGYRFYKGNHSNHEEQADNWAFNQMGIMDNQGRVKEEEILCLKCIKERSRKCLKGLVL
ncbi:MAG: hypothetical protein PHT49_06395 [Desulfovibrionales bacterium]|nr:hypothetical protein [Desulfovibrionales bacterium]